MSNLRLPPDRFFFAELRAQGSFLDRLSPGRAHEALLYQFETRVPVQADDLQARFVRVNSETILACSMTRDQLKSHKQQYPDAISVAPEALPEWIISNGKPIDPASLNLLIGEFSHPSVQRKRSLSAIRVAAMLSLAALSASVGLARRTDSATSGADAMVTFTKSATAEILAIDPENPRLHALLTSELRRLRATRQGPSMELDRPDTARRAANLLASWPTGLQTERLTIGERGVSIVARSPSAADATGLIESLDQLPGWSVSSPSISETQGGFQVRISLSAKTEGKP